jgi:hypothetical protein
MNAALESFQAAYKGRFIRPLRCHLHNDLWVLKDDANGDTRWTFARIDATGTVHAIVSVLPAEPYEGKPCFALAYAVANAYRGQGLAKGVVTRSIEEFHNGFKRQIPQFYVEVVVDKLNLASNRVALQAISRSPIEITDQFSGDPALQYFRLVG